MLGRDAGRRVMRRPHMRRALRRRSDEGQALVLVIIVTALVIILLTTVVSSVVSGLATTTSYARTNQAQLAAQTGVATELASMRAVSTYTALPCSGSGSFSLAGASSSYSATITYFAAGNQLSCSGSTLGGSTPPSLARVVSTGTASGGLTSKLVADLGIAVAGVTGPFPNYAILTEAGATITNVTVLDKSTYGNPDLYVGGLLKCTNQTTSQGSVITYDSATALNLSNKCTFVNVVGAGAIRVSGSSTISGNATSYATASGMSGCSGTFGICNDGTIGGSATAIGTTSTGAGAGIAVESGATIAGAADAEGTVTVASGGHVGSTVQNDNSLASRHIDSDYPPIAFPNYNPTPATWSSNHWNVITVGGVGDIDCNTYFKDQTNDDFMNAISTATQQTVIYAPSCNVKYTAAYALKLKANIALQVASFTASNTLSFDPTTPGTSASPVSLDFALLAGADQSCSTSTLDVDITSQADFAPTSSDPYSTINTLIYTEGEVDFSNKDSFYGQIMACEGFTESNVLQLTYSPLAGQLLSGVGGTAIPTVTVEDKYAA